jgi:arylsulfatase A-like enzyme
VFAGFGEYADTEIGRLIATLKELGQLDNTLSTSSATMERAPKAA